MTIAGQDALIVGSGRATITLPMGTQITMEDALLYPDSTCTFLSYRDIRCCSPHHPASGGDRGALCPRPSALALHLVVSACPGRWLPPCHTRCHDGDIMMCVAAAWFCLFEDRERVSVDDFMEAVRQRRERKIELVVLLQCWRR